MVSPQMMKLMLGFVENNALAGNYTDPDTEEIIVVEGEEQWKGISQFPSAIGWRKKSSSYNHKTTIWVFH